MNYEVSIHNYCVNNNLNPYDCYTLYSSFSNIKKNQSSNPISCNSNSSISLRTIQYSPYFLNSTIPSCRDNQLRIVIVHLATANAHWYATHAQTLNLFYARRHGYEFISHSCPLFSNETHIWDKFDQVKANWCKPLIIKELLKTYHYVFMLDSDAYIIDPSYRIEQFIDEYMKSNSVILPANCIVNKMGKYICWSDIDGEKALNIGFRFLINVMTVHIYIYDIYIYA